ncbi:MAG: hypothetical protein AB7O98_10315 [Hyphomonadaceae bacterium]
MQEPVDTATRIALRVGAEALLSASDDALHPPQSEAWWEHETFWFWFYEPTRKLGGWIYHYVRPNIGVSGGGVFLFDGSSWSHLEAPYYLNYSNMPAPTASASSLKFANSFTLETLAPLSHYRLTYKDRDTLTLALDWRAIMAPWADQRGAPPALWHFDQFGRVTGELVLHGERIAIDCLAMRDRSWNHLRPEPWKEGWGGGTYATAAASPQHAFYGAGAGGFVVLDGVQAPLVTGQMKRTRDAQHGFMREIEIEAKDTLGRSLMVRGESVSRLAMPISGCQGVCWTSLVRYTINGVEAWGDDQDAWPLQNWAAMRRRQAGLTDVRAARAPATDEIA